MNKKEMDIWTFLDLFMAVSFSQGQSIFDYLRLEEMLTYNDEYDDETKDIISNQLYNLVCQFREDGIIEGIAGYPGLCRILNNFNFRSVLEDNIDYLEDMRDFFYLYTADIPASKFKLKVGKVK